MRNKQKMARIIYDRGNTEKKNTIAEHEGFYLEVWDEEFECWAIVCKAQCRKSVDFPDAEDKNFIHWDILNQIARLSEQGYIIQYKGEMDKEDEDAEN